MLMINLLSFSISPMTPIRKSFAALALVLLSAVPTESLHARSVAWSSSVLDNLFDSAGTIAGGDFALDSTFSFEIGAFTNGFTPTSSNLDLWAANWVVFDAATTANSFWDSNISYYSSSANLNSNGTSSSAGATLGGIFAQNQVGYLWVFNDKAINSHSEWALVTDLNPVGNVGDSWVFPSPADQLSPDVIWALADADTVIFGGVNGIQGAGAYTNDPNSDPNAAPLEPGGPLFSLQTHVVPEPSSSLLIASTGLFWMLRKRRRNRAS